MIVKALSAFEATEVDVDDMLDERTSCLICGLATYCDLVYIFDYI